MVYFHRVTIHLSLATLLQRSLSSLITPTSSFLSVDRFNCSNNLIFQLTPHQYLCSILRKENSQMPKDTSGFYTFQHPYSQHGYAQVDIHSRARTVSASSKLRSSLKKQALGGMSANPANVSADVKTARKRQVRFQVPDAPSEARDFRKKALPDSIPAARPTSRSIKSPPLELRRRLERRCTMSWTSVASDYSQSGLASCSQREYEFETTSSATKYPINNSRLLTSSPLRQQNLITPRTRSRELFQSCLSVRTSITPLNNVRYFSPLGAWEAEINGKK
ncbi:hypothetical protein BOTBODRAFT_276730 [Botryobasidium botryosum FD-172 SS1]|uniref:Uncharacterized protein n=1 Tax=Botryobasidium botryosum (strain FD-172 SS1) TaxID=930990 RepID=A0A067MWM0_BOTB1|nr:hypothetical protein BOTBODRAFT_276730 [Botryobasidium botryosum FD-172 SS1]